MPVAYGPGRLAEIADFCRDAGMKKPLLVTDRGSRDLPFIATIMLTGSCLAGIAFLKGLGMVHAISHMVGAEYDTHHGLTNAVVLPAVLRFNAETITDKVPQMAEAMGLDDKSFDGFYRAVCDLLDALDIPKTLADIGVPTDCAAAIAEKTIQDSAAATNPRQATVPEIQVIIEQALSHGR